MAQNQVYLIKSGENSFVEETQAIVGISGGKVGIGTTHPEADLHVTGNVKVGGDLTVDGTLTTINSSTVSVDDINIELGSTNNPSDTTAEGGGITLRGAPNKTFNWYDASGWTSSENLSVADGKHFAGDELRALDAGGLSLFDTNQSGITIKDGKVGVHKTSPAYDLDVDGSGHFTSLYVDGNSVLTGEGSIFGKWEDGLTAGEIFYTGGNVGVGTTNPEHDLHVVGNGVVDGNFVVNGTSGTFNVGEFDVSGSNITLNSAGGVLGRGGLIVNAGGNKTFQYVDGSNFWQSSEDIQIVADKHLQTDTVRAIDADGLYLQNDGGKGIHIQDGGQVNIAGITKTDGGLNVGNGKFEISSAGSVGNRPPQSNYVIKWDGNEWIAGTAPGGGGSASSEVPLALSKFLDAGESIHAINFDDAPVGGYDNIPSVATDLEIVGEGSIIPYAISGLSNTGYYAIFSQDIPTENTYKLHTTFGGREVYWRTGEGGTSIYYNGDDVSVENLTVSGNLTVNGTQTIVNTETVEIKDHNIVIAANTGYNQLTNVYPVGGDYAGVFWGTGDAGAASPVSLTYQSNKGFAFEGGNVGIGTTNPTSTLSIQSTDSTCIQFNRGPIDIGNINFSNNDLNFVGESNIRFSNPGAKKYSFVGGNVGIGTTNPGAKLEISGGGAGVWLKTNNLTNRSSNTIAGQNYANLTDQLAGDENSFEIGPGYINLNRDDDVPINQLSFGMNGTLGAAIEVGGGTPTAPNNQHSLRFKVGRDNVDNKAGIERMRIDSGGNVGIGTTDPGAKLGIQNSGGSAGSISQHIKLVRGTSVGAYFSTIRASETNDVSGLVLGVNTTNALTINDNGNVGIGTTTPGTYKLNVNGNLRLSGKAQADAYQFTQNSQALGASEALYRPTTGEIAFKTSGTEAMRIDSEGNVGIGTTNPDGKLHVTDLSVSIGNVTVTNTGTDVTEGTDLNTKISDGDRIKINNEIFIVSAVAETTLTLSGTPTTANTYTAYTDNNALVVTSAGNVGIGTTNPREKLSIVGSIKISNVLSGNPVNEDVLGSIGFEGPSSINTNASAGVRLDAIAEANHSGTSAATGLQFYTKPSTTGPGSAPTPAMRIDSSGNVGIGTTNPNRKLEVVEDSASYPAKIKNTATNPFGLLVEYTNGTDSPIANPFIKCIDQETVRMMVYSDGDVWTADVGTLSSDERLKTNIVDATPKLEDIKKLKVRNFEWVPEFHPSKEGEKKIGFIAQELEKVFPGLVDEHDISLGKEEVKRKSVRLGALIPILVKGIQEQQTIIDELKSQNESLAARISALES
jgi:hypothetical protein